jgi:hypothetical protein
MASSTSGSDGSGSGGGGGGGGEGGGSGDSGGGGGGGDDGGGDDSLVDLFAVLAGAHSVGGGVFGFLTLRDGNELRQLCRLVRGDVAAARWRDAETRIRGSLAAWRACFPGAVAANLRERRDLRDADFVHLAGVKVLDMWCCRGITDAGLAHLAGIHTLKMRYCTGITGAGLAHLAGIRELNATFCRGITNAGRAFWPGLSVRPKAEPTNTHPNSQPMEVGETPHTTLKPNSRAPRWHPQTDH